MKIKKTIYVAPHLSTGGMPQYLLWKIEKDIKNGEEPIVIEYNNYSDEYVVQKNKIKKIAKVFTLGEDKSEILNIIDLFKNTKLTVHFQENPETFIDEDIIKSIYLNKDIEDIVFTAHSSLETFENIKYKPNKIIAVSEWQWKLAVKNSKIFTTCEKYERPKKERIKDGLFNENRKNILMVGLFTPGKNQGELIEIARNLPECDFHFVGNMAPNFKDYWEPLMVDLPSNCILWGEREDVDRFYANADLFYFSSKWELMPICLIEAMSYSLPILCYNLDTYSAEFDAKNVNYLNNLSLSQRVNLTSLKSGNSKYNIGQLEEDVDSYEKFFKVDSGDIMVDIGANIGLLEKKHHKTASKIYAIEPSRVFTDLIKSYNYPNVSVHTLAIGGKSGYIKIDHNEDIEDPLNVVNYAEGDIRKYHSDERDDSLTLVTTLKNFIDTYRIKKVDFFKIDCEGAEYDIFTQANVKWIKANCKKMVGEFHIHNDTQRAKILEKLDLFEKNKIRYILSSVDGVTFDRAHLEQRLDYYSEVVFYALCDDSLSFSGKATIKFDYNDGPMVTINDEIHNNYLIKFINGDTQEVLHESEIPSNSWTKCFIKYYVNWVIEVYKNGEPFLTEYFNLRGRKVFIGIESKSLGDMLAWMPYVEEFRKKNQCFVEVATFQNDLFDYPGLSFVDNSSGSYATYRIGWFYDGETIDRFRNPIDPKIQPMQKTSSDILGLEYSEIKPKIKIPLSKKRKVVGIGFHSTAQAKYWNNIQGWSETTKHIFDKGYMPLILSKEGDGYMANEFPNYTSKLKEGSLSNLIGELASCSLFVGIGSGLSWLAWACNVPVVLISGFSDDYTEFTCSRVTTPKGFCTGCFNKEKLNIHDWNWCPYEKKFECTRTITSEMVIKEIDKHI